MEAANPWVKEMKLVCKPDQLIKRRGKAGLLGIKKDWIEVKEWISSRMLKEQNVEGVVGELNTFLVEPFCAHKQEDEYYLCIQVCFIICIYMYIYKFYILYTY